MNKVNRQDRVRIDRSRRDKIQVGMLILVSLCVMVTAVLMAVMTGLLDNLVLAGVTFIIIGISAFFLIYAARSWLRDINKGIPFRDERSRRVVEKACGNSLLVMIYLLLALGWYSDHGGTELGPTDVTGIGILGGAVSFVVMWLYFNSRASLD
jgi:hypothetical protein